MPTKEEIVALFEDNIQVRKDKIRAYVMNTDNTYEDRLYIYRYTPKHLQYHKEWVYHHPSLEDDDWMNMDWWDRCQKIEILDIIETRDDWSDEKMREFLAGCMNDGVWSFTFDW